MLADCGSTLGTIGLTYMVLPRLSSVTSDARSPHHVAHAPLTHSCLQPQELKYETASHET